MKIGYVRVSKKVSLLPEPQRSFLLDIDRMMGPTLSSGRFEPGIGAGDFFEEAQAWGLTVPDATTRIAGLKETVEVLRRIWTGEFVTFEGEQPGVERTFLTFWHPFHSLARAVDSMKNLAQ